MAKCNANPSAATTTLPDTCIDGEGRLLSGGVATSATATSPQYTAGEDVSGVQGQLYAICSSY